MQHMLRYWSSYSLFSTTTALRRFHQMTLKLIIACYSTTPALAWYMLATSVMRMLCWTRIRQLFAKNRSSVKQNCFCTRQTFQNCNSVYHPVYPNVDYKNEAYFAKSCFAKFFAENAEHFLISIIGLVFNLPNLLLQNISLQINQNNSLRLLYLWVH